MQIYSGFSIFSFIGFNPSNAVIISKSIKIKLMFMTHNCNNKLISLYLIIPWIAIQNLLIKAEGLKKDSNEISSLTAIPSQLDNSCS